MAVALRFKGILLRVLHFEKATLRKVTMLAVVASVAGSLQRLATVGRVALALGE